MGENDQQHRDEHSDAASRTAEAGRDIQREADAKSRQRSGQNGGSEKKPVQAGPREYPGNPLPEQHQAKPGIEAQLNPRPMYQAPAYKGSGKLEGMATLVTGADSGIGRAVAVLFAREGADVAVAYLDEHEDADETRRAVESEGARCLLLPGDVADPRYCRDAVEKVVSTFGKLDILVNNAAFQQHVERIEDVSDAQFDRTLKTNLYGYFNMVKASVKHLRQGSSILMTGSVTGIRGSKELLDYSMTKGGIHAFARSLAGSLIDRGIRVNVVAPGPVWTPLNPADRQGGDVAEFGGSTPMKRAAQPEEIAPAYVFLAAPSCASYITGEILPIIGGYG